MPSKIEWTQETWNPISGCSPVSEGCRNCYARRMARRLAGRHGYPETPHHFDVTLHRDKLDVPLRRKKPTTYFVCSMSDLFHEDVPFDFITEIFDVMCNARSQHHIFQILTKRPERISQWLNWVGEFWPGDSPFSIDWEVCGYAANVHLGVSIENQETADKRREHLRQCPAAVKFVSYEPALALIDWTGWEFVDQIISGGESGPGARPSHPDWHRATRDFCQANGIAYFFKQWGRWTWRTGPDDGLGAFYDVGKHRAGRLLDGREWNQMPEVTK